MKIKDKVILKESRYTKKESTEIGQVKSWRKKTDFLVKGISKDRS